MAKISVDLMGEKPDKVSVDCFTIPDSGICITIKTVESQVEIDIPEKVHERLIDSLLRTKKQLSPDSLSGS
jgi:hypothetical protein